MISATLVLAVDNRAVTLTLPDTVALLPIARPVKSGETLAAAQQQSLVEAALAAPAGGPGLRQLASGKRRAAVVVGDLSMPAPYEIALAPVVNTLLAADIRPTRITFLAYPGRSGPLLGRGAIRRYGEEFVGAYEFRNWTAPPGEVDPAYAAADLRLVVMPALADVAPPAFAADLHVNLYVGQKASPDIVACETAPSPRTSLHTTPPPGPLPASGEGEGGWGSAADVFLCGSGGGAADATLEEALLSLALRRARADTVVLAFSGTEGLGSAHFTLDLWALLTQAEEVLAKSGKLDAPDPAPPFDPAGTLASALTRYRRVVLFSPELERQPELGDLAEFLSARPGLSQRLHLCGASAELWPLLTSFFGPEYRLAAEPLGWRARD